MHKSSGSEKRNDEKNSISAQEGVGIGGQETKSFISESIASLLRELYILQHQLETSSPKKKYKHLD